MIKQRKASVAVIAGIIVLVVAVVATGIFLYPYSPDNPPHTEDSNSTEQGIHDVVNANNQFAFELYSELDKTENGNMFYSPYSISAALAMTYEGARGQTADEMKSVFHFPEKDILRANFAAIYNGINSNSNDYKLNTGNALWVQKDFPLLKDYMNAVENYYGGKAANLDFVTETEKSRQTINAFIEEQTNNKIKELIPRGAVIPQTKLVLTNAIYFKGDWEWEFDKSYTLEREFTVTPENTVMVSMMNMYPNEARFNYANLNDLQILELPYKGNNLSMLIILPKQGSFFNSETEEMETYSYNLEDIELSAEKLEEYKSQMSETNLDSISIPKFEFNTKYFMADALSNLGMPSAFTENADFSGMDDARDLFISSVIHQAYVKVDEKGTEATAATVVSVGETAAMPINIFRADHPFIFIIQEKNTGNILFMGRIVDPSAVA